ncbi:MAG: SulP family inorganic anion transporter [Gemmataceae bacterium]
MADHAISHPTADAPQGSSSPWRYDLLAGFLVFLIALPLCLAIARASNYPPIAGIWTAVLGGIICSFISNSQMTIKGPAAGLIVIVAGSVLELGREFGAGLSEGEQLRLGYQLSLGIGVVAGIVQILFGLFRAGKLADFFPLSAVHGLLASIGIIIIAKQIYLVFGIDAPKGAEPLELLAHLPAALPKMNPEIATIGVISLLILVALPFVRNRYIRRIPGPMLALLIAVPLGMLFDLEHQHVYLFPDTFFLTPHYAEFEVGPRFLVDMPNVLQDPTTAFCFPNLGSFITAAGFPTIDFRGVFTGTGVKYVVLFAIIGSLESLLSAKAIDLLDKQRRKTDMNRDLLAVGVANTLAAAIGALPMISEIVRSSANINNGARSSKANLFHGLFLLAFVVFLPDLIHRIPLAALGAMLVYTGYRLASPREFARTYRIGTEQLVIFVSTIAVTLATDLLIGIFAGVAVKLAFHLFNGVPLRGMFRPQFELVQRDGQTPLLVVKQSAVFTNWIGLKGAIDAYGGPTGITVDLSQTRLVDHSVMEKLHEVEREMREQGKHFSIIGLEDHQPLSRHPQAARKKTQPKAEVTQPEKMLV